jgi:hypothetical protein
MATATAAAPATAVAAHKSFFSKVDSFFKKVGYYVSEGFTKLFGSNAAKAFAVSSLALLKTDLGKIALTAVQEAEKVAAGVDKYTTAFSSIASQVKTQGLAAGESEINMLIELAVQTVNGAFGQKA